MSDGWKPAGPGVTVTPREWIARGRQGLSVGICRAEGCGGALYVPVEPTSNGDTVNAPFHQRDGIRWFEAICDGCGANYVQSSADTRDRLDTVIPRSATEREQRGAT